MVAFAVSGAAAAATAATPGIPVIGVCPPLESTCPRSTPTPEPLEDGGSTSDHHPGEASAASSVVTSTTSQDALLPSPSADSDGDSDAEPQPLRGAETEGVGGDAAAASASVPAQRRAQPTRPTGVSSGFGGRAGGGGGGGGGAGPGTGYAEWEAAVKGRVVEGQEHRLFAVHRCFTRGWRALRARGGGGGGPVGEGGTMPPQPARPDLLCSPALNPPPPPADAAVAAAVVDPRPAHTYISLNTAAAGRTEWRASPSPLRAAAAVAALLLSGKDDAAACGASSTRPSPQPQPPLRRRRRARPGRPASAPGGSCWRGAATAGRGVSRTTPCGRASAQPQPPPPPSSAGLRKLEAAGAAGRFGAYAAPTSLCVDCRLPLFSGVPCPATRRMHFTDGGERIRPSTSAL